MKKLLIFTAIFLSNYYNIFSCGYYPYGEDVRYSLFLPDYFKYDDFSSFNYNADLFGFDYKYDNQYESNVDDWYNFTEKKVSIDEIDECINALQFTDIHINSSNLFVQYLYKNKLNNVIQYLITAKECETYNTFDNNDNWERNEIRKDNSNYYFKILIKKINSEKSSYLKRKYAFLAIRIAYYNANYNQIKEIFKKHFANGEKDYLYYWALYFNSFHNKNTSNDIANIMAYSKEKKYACYYYFHNQFKLEEALLNANSNEEIANAYAFASVQRIEPNLNYLQKIYENNSNSRILDFLLLREINKIEDWVYTPYYTNFLPSLENSYYWESESSNDILSTKILQTRSQKSRLYAKEVLDFINKADLSKIQDVMLWKAAQINLLFIARNYDECLKKITSFERKYKKEKSFNQIEKIKALCIISRQKEGKAIINEDVKTILLKHLNDLHFLFSAGRELEYRKNLPDGIALISYADNMNYFNDESYYNHNVNWQGNRLRNSGNLKYFYDYFDYVDFVYSADDLQKVVDKLNTKADDKFHNEIFKNLKCDKNYLTDLLGTKYLRENRLSEAVKIFESIGQKYWDENYNSWERDKYDDYYTFDLNPFYDIKYTESFIPHSEKFFVNKLTVSQHLKKYIELADNPMTHNRDYYYFIVANCYLNMTQYGHSWMMRRFSSTSDYNEGNNESFIDEIEYRNGIKAQKYYHLAFENAKTNKFKALCLRMEDYAKDNIASNYNQLKLYYPEYYDDLSSCLYLEMYFKNIR